MIEREIEIEKEVEKEIEVKEISEVSEEVENSEKEVENSELVVSLAGRELSYFDAQTGVNLFLNTPIARIDKGQFAGKLDGIKAAVDAGILKIVAGSL
ncbi:MAG: hypothetical protein DDT23_00336 [candidate division WS2 bacterium]|nr:hypothetical protein [Candidatus Lithacetigena glycinireducens]